ncbi:MAG: hypothetical protein WBX22_00340 [Silvibacterium sp.]|jgi:hypothetical protein
MEERRRFDPQDISLHELVNALSDPNQLDNLMKKYNLSREQVLARAELVAKQVSDGIQHVNCV